MITFAISTLGCPKNLVDSENMTDRLLNDGYCVTDSIDKADVLILNTCGFIDKAKEESVQKILEYVELKKLRPFRLAVVGCLVQRYKDALCAQIPDVDIWLGINEIFQLSDKIKHCFPKKKLIKPEYPRNEWETKLTPQQYTYLKIAEGCNHRCSFCVIPQIRGNYMSRSMDEIISDARYASEKGAKEICLVAQDTSNYGRDLNPPFRLSDLIRGLEKIDHIRWIRLMYLYPDRIDDELIDTIASSNKVCKYLDIPFQHLSTKILKSMFRSQTNESIFELVGKLRKKIPDLFIRTSFIVGYPGETSEDFDILYNGINELKFERLGVFIFSPEEGTFAEKLKPRVSKKQAHQRFNDIMSLQRNISFYNHNSIIGKNIEIMIDDICDDGKIIGRSQWDAPEIDCNVIIKNDGKTHSAGDFLNVNISSAYEYDLEGTII